LALGQPLLAAIENAANRNLACLHNFPIFLQSMAHFAILRGARFHHNHLFCAILGQEHCINNNPTEIQIHSRDFMQATPHMFINIHEECITIVMHSVEGSTKYEHSLQ